MHQPVTTIYLIVVKSYKHQHAHPQPSVPLITHCWLYLMIIYCRDNGSKTIGDLVDGGKRVILGYAFKFDRRLLPDSHLFWPAVQHLWAQTDEMDKLEEFMKQQLCKPKRYLNSMMAELTPTIQNVLFLKYHGLRELAAKVNIHYDHWFRQQYWNCTNIVAADFFLGSDIVQIAIDVNRRRFGAK